MKNFFLLSILFTTVFSYSLYSQTRSIEAKRVRAGSIKIDGNPNDTAWMSAEVATGFTEFEPSPGETPSEKTRVKIAYDQTALYLLGIMYNDDVSKISTELTERDDMSTADYFGMIFDPFGDNDLGYSIGVTAAGVQFDFKLQENRKDFSWNAVWKSRVNITDSAWIAEFEIPYSALRFPGKSAAKRKVNFVRFMGDGRRQVSWNPVDPTENNFNLSSGYLENFHIEDAPVRLSLTPYISAYAEKQVGQSQTNYYLKGGADLKYGINESFTLDMMLIPDFGQVRTDDQSLNLSPYEIYYSEKRTFFLEGTELFDRGKIFYSRRIGGKPRFYEKAYEEIQENENLLSNPQELQLLNAVKISGKTKGGTSLGLLNALSLPAEAVIEDTLSNRQRSVLTQGFTNYNVSAFQQSLRNNSRFSLVNTNMLIPGNNFSANVTAADFKLAEKNKTYAIFGTAAYSRNRPEDKVTEEGYSYDLSLKKIKGNFKFDLETELKDNNYNPNYMGYLRRNNEIENNLSLSYTLYNPSQNWLRISPSVFWGHEMNYSPRHLQSIYAGFNVHSLMHNHLSIWARGAWELADSYNFDETRTEDRYLKLPPARNFSLGISTDYSNTFAVDINTGMWYSTDGEQKGASAGISPRVKPSDNILIVARSNYNYNQYYGYADTRGSEILFGMRLQDNIQNTLDGTFIFNNKSSVSLRLSHIRSTVQYEGGFVLSDTGRPEPIDENFDPIDYNMLNIYLMYQLEFLPGSFLSLAWQNNVIESRNELYDSYFSALSRNFADHPDNSISLKVLFYIDYFTTKNRLKKL